MCRVFVFLSCEDIGIVKQTLFLKRGFRVRLLSGSRHMSAVKWVLQCLWLTREVTVSGVFNRDVCPLPGVCVLPGSVTQLTVSVCGFYTPSTQLRKPAFTPAKPAVTATFSVCARDVRDTSMCRNTPSCRIVTILT